MAKLGYTWYPKDWGNSESVFEMNLSERGLYRELIDLAMLNDNKTEIKLEVWSRKFAITSEDLKAILGRLMILSVIEVSGEKLFIPSCESRLNMVRGGKKSSPSESSKVNLLKGSSKGISEAMPKQIKTESKVNEDLQTRTKLFKDKCRPYLSDYGHEILLSFFNYWSEPTQDNKKMRFELEKTFEISRRLTTWKKNESNFKKPEPLKQSLL